MHHPHTSTSRRITRFTPFTRTTRSVGLAALALGLAFTAIPATTAHAGAPTRPAAHLEAAATGLDDPAKKDIAMQLVSSAENSTLDWKGQYGYIEDIGDGRGYTAGIIGFCSGTGDMLALVELYAERKPGNVLAPYLPALRAVDGTDSHEGLDPGFTGDWAEAASDPVFQQAQNDERDRVYFDPAVRQGKADGLGTLGQFAYYDAIVMHGGGGDSTSFGSIRERALAQASPPSQGGDEVAYLDAFLDARVWAMEQEEAHSDTSRVDTAQRVFLRDGNLNLDPPLDWQVYGQSFHIG
uniref:Chitosanase n=1 Tax=Streptomyces sp. NBC_00148 TaxID=2903626 RepID=A0AAU1M081_9ACTN